jgi:AraC-like DNA-binding protein
VADPLTEGFGTGRTAAKVVRFELVGRDPDQAVRDIGGVHGAVRLSAEPTGVPFEYRYTALGDSDVTIRRAQLHGSMRGSVPPGDEYVVTWLATGTGTIDLGDEQYPLGLEVPVMLPPDRAFAFTVADTDQRLVHLDRAFVAQVAAERAGDAGVPDGILRFDERRTPDPQTARRWQAALTALARALRVGGPDSAAWQEAKTVAAEVLLDLFPPAADELPPVLAQPRNARLRAAVEYIHAHASEPVTVADLSEVSGLSVRSVQESFRRVFDVSPLTYLRHVRLDHVRAELLESGPQAGAVGDVARRWGFAHLGRFSASYAERFGEYPKQTLRR